MLYTGNKYLFGEGIELVSLKHSDFFQLDEFISVLHL